MADFDDVDDSDIEVEDRQDEEPDTLRDAGRDLVGMARYVGHKLMNPSTIGQAGSPEPDDSGRKRARGEMGLDFEGGGSVDEEGALDGPGDQQTRSISSALKAVNAAMMYGRQKHGLMGQQKQSFEGGGSVEEEFPDTADVHRGLMPTYEPEQDQGPQQYPQSQGIPVEGPEQPERPAGSRTEQMVQGAGRRIMQYLQSADADPRLAQTVENEVDPEGLLDEDTRKLLSVEHARSRGGEDASWKLVQNYRKKYDGYRAFAAAAMQNQDIAGAARAATQAYPNMLDGSRVTFEPAQDGVLANITPQGGQQRRVPLSAQQFNEWLTGDSGQYDNMLARGGAKSLEELAARRGAQPAAPAQGGQAPQQGGNRPFNMGSQVQRPTAMNRPSTGIPEGDGTPADEHDIRPFAAADVANRSPDKYRPLPQGYRSPAVPADTPNEAAARKIYPWASQEQQRAQAGANMNTADLDRAAKVEQRVAPAEMRATASTQNAQTRANTATDVANTRAASYDGRTQAQYRAAQERIQSQMQRGGNTDQLRRDGNAVRIIVEKLRNGVALNPQEQQVHERIMGGASGGGGAPPPQQRPGAQPPQRQGAAPAPAQQGAQRPAGAAFRDKQGRFYDKFGQPL